MDRLLDIWEKPEPGQYLIAGWHQWADAGSASSGLPQYLIEHTQARMIGEIRSGSFYLFQVPGTHHLLRPIVSLQEGYRQDMEESKNEFYCTAHDGKSFMIFLGEEPHRNEAEYANAFFDAVEELGVKRVAAVAGVYGAVPYDRDRNVSCVYSLPHMKDELSKYAVKFSDYEGGATISMYLADQAEYRNIEFLRFCAYVPSYDLSNATLPVQAIAIGHDFKTWYDLMVRLKHMFGLDLDLSDLQARSEQLISEWDNKIDQVAEAMPQLNVRAYLDEIAEGFTEMSFVPLSDVWEDELRDLLGDL
jgi:proteasome assembly chaperone (PAC2) family protein